MSVRSHLSSGRCSPPRTPVALEEKEPKSRRQYVQCWLVLVQATCLRPPQAGTLSSVLASTELKRRGEGREGRGGGERRGSHPLYEQAREKAITPCYFESSVTRKHGTLSGAPFFLEWGNYLP